MNEALAVDARGVSKTFGSVRAVDDISLQVRAGEVYGVLGPNGAGKTTLLRMLFGLIRPVAGFIESPRFYPYLSGRQNLEGLAMLDGGGAAALIGEVLDLVEMDDRADLLVGGYSYGMRQRLGVAASLLREPRLLVLDEPANGLDPAGIRDMRALVKRLAGRGLTVLLSSHDMDEVEEICDNVTIMTRGTVAFHGTITHLRTLAPDPGHALATTDDTTALALGAQRHGITVTRDPHAALVVTGPAPQVSSYVGDLVRAGVGLLAFTPTRTPLEALFFMLTDDPTHQSLDRAPVQPETTR